MKRREFIQGVLGSGLGAAISGCSVPRLFSDSPAADDGVLRALRVDHDACIGCFLCVETCHWVNSRRPERPGDRGAAPVRDRSLIHVHSFLPGPYHVVWACLGCPDIPCVRACDYYADPLGHVKALHIDVDTGAIALEREWCAGCERCIEACRSDGGAVLTWDDEEYITGACHLCDGHPECAAVCPVSAITMVEVDRRGSLEPRTPQEVAREGISRRLGREVAPEPVTTGNVPLRALRVDNDRCTGCRRCEAACDERNGAREVGGQLLRGLGDTVGSLIRVHGFDGPYYVAWACLGCPDLPCVCACEEEAFAGAGGPGQRRALGVSPETGAIHLLPEFCTACQKCIEACERDGGGVLRWDPVQYVAGACHLCGGDPACVTACPFDAIELVTVDRTQPLEPRSVEAVARQGVDRVYRGGRPG